MPRWLRRLYNTIANFVLPRSLRTASNGSVGRNAKQLHNESDKPRKRGKSNKSCKSVKPDQRAGTCHRNRDTNCSARDRCTFNECGHKPNNELHVEGCICSICRDFNDYTNATSKRAKRQNTSPRVRASNEPRGTKRTDNTARTNIENITGIPAGTTI